MPAFAFLLCLAAAVPGEDAPLWRIRGFTPGAVDPRPQPPTACRWLWCGEEVRAGGEAFLRRAFDLPAAVESAKVDFNADDRGEMHLNGRKAGKGDFARLAKPGRNVVALRVWNAHGPAGCIFQATFRLVDGRRVRIVSDRRFRSASSAPGGWTDAAFDDSGWAPARELGDVSLQPWANLHDYASTYATDEELAAIRRFRNFPMPLPVSMAQEPDPECHVAYRGGMPKIVVNGRDYEPDINLAGVRTPFAVSANVKTHSLGIPFHELQFEPADFEKAAGVYDFAAVDAQARRLLHHIPDAWIFLRFNTAMPRWCEAHRGECVGYAKTTAGNDELRGRPLRPSAASAAYRAELSRFFALLGEASRREPWMKRVVGVRICWGVYTEWHTYGFFSGPDVGTAMADAFRRRTGLEVPSAAERMRGGCLLDPEADAKVLAFHDAMSAETAGLAVHMAKAAKRSFPGRLVGGYMGYVFTALPPEGQNCRYDLLLDAQEIDFFSAPACYSHDARQPGGSFNQRTVPDAFRRHGKLLILEDDMRFHHLARWSGPHYHTSTPAESAAVMRRDWMLRVFDGSGIQLIDPADGWWKRANSFDDPAVLEAIHEAMAATRALGEVDAESGNDALIVVDPLARFRWGWNAHECDAVRNASSELPQHVETSGAAVDFATLQDYLAFDYPHRFVFFADAYSLSPDERKRLDARFRRPHSRFFRLDVPGIGAAEPSFAEAIPLPSSAAQWRDAFRRAGVHLWTECGGLVRRRGCALLHATGRGGEHRIRLPDGFGGAVELFGGERFCGRELLLSSDGPATWIFLMEKDTEVTK